MIVGQAERDLNEAYKSIDSCLNEIKALKKALTILKDKAYKISDTTYQLQFSSKMMSEIENVLKN